jgi:Tfp pilus assembly protein PilN
VARARARRIQGGVWVLAAISFLILAAVVVQDFRLRSKVDELREVRQGLKSELEAIREDSAYVAEEDVRALRELEESRVFWTDKLGALSQLIGEKVAFSGMKWEESGLRLEGLADPGPKEGTFDVVSDLVSKLQSDSTFAHTFSRVEFLASRRIPFRGRDLLGFTLYCRLHKP